MAVKRYDGSAWQTVAGLGAQGAAATSSSIATWVKTASGGETSLSGNDDNSQALSYTVGQELVFINGTLLKRGSDYTATNGTSITGLTALAANDVATVWTVNAFSVTNAISSGLVTTTGDIIYASAANTPARLGIGSTGNVLTVSGGVPAWSAPAGGGKVLQVVYASSTSDTTVASSTYTDSGLSGSITPTKSTSKVLILVNQVSQASRSSETTTGALRLLRGSTTILEPAAEKDDQLLIAVAGAANTNLATIMTLSYLDSPSTTSSTTYKTQGAVRYTANSGQIQFQPQSSISTMILMEVDV